MHGFGFVSFNIPDCCSFTSQFVCVQNLRPLQVCPSIILTTESDDGLITSDDEQEEEYRAQQSMKSQKVRTEKLQDSSVDEWVGGDALLAMVTLTRLV